MARQAWNCRNGDGMPPVTSLALPLTAYAYMFRAATIV